MHKRRNHHLGTFLTEEEAAAVAGEAYAARDRGETPPQAAAGAIHYSAEKATWRALEAIQGAFSAE